MLKRLFLIALLTGCAHITTLFVLQHLSRQVSAIQIYEIGQVDALLNMLLSILAAGLLMTTVRDISLHQDWKRYYINSQQARLTLSLIIFCLSFIGLFSSMYYVVAMAPFLALNADYSLYARGKPILASMLAFIRTFVPFSFLLIASAYWPSNLTETFIIAHIAVFIFSGIIISNNLKVPYFIKPSIKSLQLYFQTLPLAVVSFGYYFLGLGILIIANFFYPPTYLALCYLVLKIYVIFKGLLRIVNQAYISEMRNDDICHKVDLLSLSASVVFSATIIFFPSGFKELIMNNLFPVSGLWIYILAFCTLLIAPFISLTTKAILENEDQFYFKISLFSILTASFLCFVFAYIFPDERGVLLSIAVGEFICVSGLIVRLKKTNWIINRVNFLIQNLPLLIIPLLLRFTGGDNVPMFFLSTVLLGAMILLKNKNVFRLKINTIPVIK